MNNNFENWEKRYAIRCFADFAEGESAVGVIRARQLISTAFAGAALCLSGDVGNAKSSLQNLLLQCRNCEMHQAGIDLPCGHCNGCRRARRGGGTLEDLCARFTPDYGAGAESIIDENIGVWARWRGGPSRRDAQFVLALDDLHFMTWLNFGWLQALVDEYGGNGVLFVLSTSAPEVMPPSLRSRCEHICMRSPSIEQLARWFCGILIRERITCDPGFPQWLAIKASRRPRTLLNLGWQLGKATRHFSIAAAERILILDPI